MFANRNMIHLSFIIWNVNRLYKTSSSGITYATRNIMAYCNHIWGCSVASNLNIMGPRQDGRHFPDDIYKWIFFIENCCIWIKISLKYVPKSPIDNNLAFIQIMARHRPGDKPLSEPMIVRLQLHICVSRLQWVNKTGLLQKKAMHIICKMKPWDSN